LASIGSTMRAAAARIQKALEQQGGPEGVLAGKRPR
jgi:hypothetical protein